MYLLILASFPGNASATTYDTDFPIVMDEPTLPPWAAGTVAWEMERTWLAVAPEEDDTSQTSSWAYVTCHLVDGDLTIKFSATSGSWPSSFPTSATCSSGGYTLTINLTSGSMSDALVRSWTFDPNVGVTIETDINHSGNWVWELPAGTYAAGANTAMLSPTATWPGVECQVLWLNGDSNSPVLQVELSHGMHTEAAGMCMLPRHGGGLPYLVPLTINYNTY